MKATEEKTIQTESEQSQPEIKHEIQAEVAPVKEESKEAPKIQDFEGRMAQMLDVIAKQQEQIKELTTNFKEKSEQLDSLQQEIDSKKPMTLKIVEFEGGFDFSRDKERVLNQEMADLKSNAKKILDSLESQFA